ncbi:MAG: hypothetical protein ACLQLC_15960 [Candidatus Sulfotelmatobacter sp.]
MGTKAQLASAAKANPCIARQPILTADERVVGYELFFREDRLVRARFCELIAPRVEHASADLFLLGMLSLIDAILAVPMGLVLEELSLDPAIKNQLLSAKTGKKTPLSSIYDLMLAREVGDWGLVTSLGKQLNVSLSFVAECSNAAMRWAHEVTKAHSTPSK